MTRHIVLGNQSLLINIDRWFQVRDIYFPHVGQENHLMGHTQRIGVFTDGRLSWVNEESWERTPAYKNETLATENRAVNRDLGIELLLEENVYCEANIFIRKITVKNIQERQREVRLFFNQDFHIYGDGIGDTAVYQMDHNVIVHYKRSRYFLIGVLKSNKKEGIKTDIDDYAIGQAENGGFRGTYVDAEDGVLSKNPVAQGSVDSTVRVSLQLPKNSSKVVYYYMTIGKNFQEVYALNDLIMEESPESLLERTEECQRAWVNREGTDLSGLEPRLATLYKRSLLVIKTQTDAGGAIIAANDSDNMQFNRDTYSYMWPRDGALVSIAMIKAGFPEFTKPFFRFCKDVLWWAGCMLHKYNPDGTLGSSWHPWIEYGQPALPIQEDETALVIHALWKYYEATGDLEFIKELHEPLIEKAVFFMDGYSYPNNIPVESYDLWEERRGIFTFTASAVYRGLLSGEELGHVLKDDKICSICHVRYSKLRQALINELYDSERGVFPRGIRYEDHDTDRKIIDRTVDSSVYGIFEFDLLPADDPRVVRTMQNLEEKLWVPGKGGMARYENDTYHRTADLVTGNPWIICTLWLAKWYIAKAKEIRDLEKALELINWVADCSLETGIMPEQVHPFTEESLSVAPLTWSHAEFVDTITRYQEKKAQLEV
ncbi:MAG: glycoside hydrolase family 15 protein [Methanosarcina sp.]|uniref:glycoside hydrolase family 15 protein n=1 Tax=Methanosarcina sp. TaxID=2213 RepID=UPI00262DF252|nr:glycoside hydrolase family 15 protein [Methanosarcina sp.]MDD3246161.1 glycoside hydrolase family 15 protein [Methanosarcina sp.]